MGGVFLFTNRNYEKESKITISNSTFLGNYANNTGGCIYSS